ncbi:MAG: hypothetical protein ABI578_06060 [Chloroflexota bacterium]
MIEDPYDPIETTGGPPPRSSVAERAVVGLALLALGAGLLIAGGNLLSIVRPSPSVNPVADATPSGTPQATPPPLSQVILQPGSPPSVVPQPVTYPYSGWIRATSAVATRSAPSLSAEVGMVLAAGDVAWAEEWTDYSGWFQAFTSSGTFWIEPDIALSSRVERVQQQPSVTSGYVRGLTAGADGFVANIVAAGLDTSRKPMLAYSADGSGWVATDLPSGNVQGVAWGPAGWLAAVTHDDASPYLGGGGSPVLEFWRSRDGLHWQALGYAPSGLEGDVGVQLVASRDGYVIESYGGRRSRSPRLWSSRDGLAWRESAIPPGLSDFDSAGVVALDGGFYLWNTTSDIGVAAFSEDGANWSKVDGGPTGDNLQLGQVDGRIVALSTDRFSGGVRRYLGQITGSTVVWDRPEVLRLSEEPGNVAIATMVSDGTRALAIGWQTASDTVVAWGSLDGVNWAKVGLPDNAFGGIPHVVAGGPRGFVVLGSRHTLRGDNPIFWHQTDAGSWEPERSPLIAHVADPSRDFCGPPPQTWLDFVTVDRALAVVCFGDTQITFRAWSVACDCSTESDETYRPSWLASAGTNQLFLAPSNTTSEAGISTTSVVLDPALGVLPDPSWTPRLLELTGHFDDPAAASCHWTPGINAYSSFSGQHGIIDSCREQFVVTAVRVVERP